MSRSHRLRCTLGAPRGGSTEIVRLAEMCAPVAEAPADCEADVSEALAQPIHSGLFVGAVGIRAGFSALVFVFQTRSTCEDLLRVASASFAPKRQNFVRTWKSSFGRRCVRAACQWPVPVRVRHVRVASERMLFDWMKCGVSGARRLGCSLFWVWAWGMRPFLLLHWALYLDAYQMGAYGQEMESERWQLRARSALAAQSTVVCCSLYSGSLARQTLYYTWVFAV
jgi:hypothetical protein